MVHFPKEVFSNILEYCDTRDKDKHKQVRKYIRVMRIYADLDALPRFASAYDRCLAYKLPFTDEKAFDKVYNYLIDSDDWCKENTGKQTNIDYEEYRTEAQMLRQIELLILSLN
jgi:hypothetical protein